MKTRVQNPDLIITLLIIFSIIFTTLGFYIQSINADIKIYGTEVDEINKLRLLNKDFNHFAMQKGGFINYDIINKQIKDFNITLKELTNRVNNKNKNSLLLKILKEIRDDYNKKVKYLEHIKSYNSTLSSSIYYLSDLKRNIEKSPTINKKEKALIRDTLFITIQEYAGIMYDKHSLMQNMENLNNLSQKSGNKYIKYFFQQIKTDIQKIKSIKDEHKTIEKLNISSKLDLIHHKLKNKYRSLLDIGKRLLYIIIFAILFMIASIYAIYRKFLQNKIKLQAYKFAIENSDNSIVITDTKHTITYVNDAFEKETGFNKDEALGQKPSILKSGVMPEEHYLDLNNKLENRQKWEGEFINRHKDGSLLYEKASINPIIINDKVESYIAIKLNITKYIEQEKKVEFLALHDTLTSLPNRLNFEQYFYENILVKNKKAALMYLDLDRFKTINDSLGHHIGDGLLKVFTQRLQYALDKNDFIARVGGDEFVIIVELDDNKDISTIANRILNLLQTPIVVDGHSSNITTSIGVSFFPNDGQDLETLTKYADTAMYRAKKDGRNNFKIFTQQLSDEIDERLKIEQALRSALKNSELYLVYQPKYNLKTLKISGFEALIRWENKKLGFIGPDKFIPIAEEIGLIDHIGLFVFEQACKDFKILKDLDKSIKNIAINISTIQFRDNNFIDVLNKISSKEEISPSNIELEITESCIMDGIEKNIDMLYELRDEGYKIAIDDFGTGYSSFSYLKKLPINTIKIDKSFVDDITTKKADRDIVKAIISLGNNLGFNIVAEGIETIEQERLLKKFGSNLGQGYLFSKPQKVEELKEFINKQHKKECLI